MATLRPLLTRAAVFLAICLIFSGLLGPRIIGHGMVGRYGFEVYGGTGKALLFATVALALLAKRRGFVVAIKPWRPALAMWLCLAVASYALAWFFVSKLLSFGSDVAWEIGVHASIIASLVFAALGTFGPANAQRLASAYKTELTWALGLAGIFYGFLSLVYRSWSLLSAIALHAVAWLLNLSGLGTTLLRPETLQLDKFSITITQYCSGVESIALFSALYLCIAVLEWPRLNHTKLLLTFPFALSLVFVCNILRIFALILAGYYLNPHVAFSLFHTYAGMIVFILYSALFWRVSYGWMLSRSSE